MKESDLANIVVKYFEDKGYTAYKEVSKNGRGGSARTDCYFIDAQDQSVSVEVKTTLNVKVMQQAVNWKEFSNYSFICVPKSKKKDFKQRKFLYDICKNYLKIGVIEVDMKSGIVYELFPSELNKKGKRPPLFEEQKQSQAGNDSSEFHTKFKNTTNKIIEYMADKESADYNEMLKDIEHHYRTHSSASSALKKLIGPVIKGYYLQKVDTKWKIFKSPTV